MKLEIDQPVATVADDPLAAGNRQALLDADVYGVRVVGGPGCGKSTLLRKTAERLTPDVRVAVITADPEDPRPASIPRGLRLLRVDLAGRPCIEPRDIAGALPRLGLETLDLLLVENVGALPASGEGPDLGQDATVTVFSAAAGDDKARRHPGLVRSSTAVLLNKTDLLLSIPFDVGAFRDDVRRINADAPLFEVGALSGQGMVPWLNWLKRHLRKSRGADDVSHWFG